MRIGSNKAASCHCAMWGSKWNLCTALSDARRSGGGWFFFVKVHFLRFSPWEINERQEDNIRKLRKVAAGDEAESDKAAWQESCKENQREREMVGTFFNLIGVRQACRYCLVDSGDLVAPCECKGSGQWVHLSCLRQWQKSVLLTQSTHPKYQTRIDEICNSAVCLKQQPLQTDFFPKDGHVFSENWGDLL